MNAASAVLAALHYVTLAFGFAAIFYRGVLFRELARKGNEGDRHLKSLFRADSLWGLAAILWIVTGAGRAFGPLEKGTDFYLSSPLFGAKILLFGAVFLIELKPMRTLIGWRIRRGKEMYWLPEHDECRKLAKRNDWEVVLTLIIPIFASLMARGVGL